MAITRLRIIRSTAGRRPAAMRMAAPKTATRTAASTGLQIMRGTGMHMAAPRSLEAIQRRIQTAGERLLEYQRKSQSQALLTSLQEEVASQKERLEKLMAEATERAAQLRSRSLPTPGKA